MTNRIAVRVLLLSLCAAGLFAQKYSFKYYGQENGLGNLDILALQQDRTGFLWVGTANGLYRYDGKHFRMFTQADGLPSMKIYSITETADGTLWVGTVYGIARRVGDRFEKVDMGKSRGTRSIVGTSQHGLVVASELGLVVGRPSPSAPAGLEFRLYRTPGPVPIALGVAVGPGGRIWYGCGRSICVLDGERAASLADWGVPADEYTAITVDRQGNVWARSLTRLIELPAGTQRFVVAGSHLASAVKLGTLLVDRAGNLLVPTAHGLACRSADGTWRSVDKLNGLPGSSTVAVLEDREGSLWIGVGGVGLVRWIGRRHWEAWTEAEGLSHDMVWGISRDVAGTLWAATEHGLSWFDTDQNRWRAAPSAALRNGRCINVTSARDKLWIGISPGSLAELDPRHGSTVLHGAKSGLASDFVMSVASDLDGHLWVGTSEGLFEGLFTGDRLNFRNVPLNPEMPRPFVSSVRCDRNGRLWVSTWYGLHVRENGAWLHFGAQDGLRQSSPTYMGEGANTEMWTSYREPLGMTRMRLVGGRLEVRHYKRADGLPSDKVLSVTSDRSGRVWAGTDRGLAVFDGKKWTSFDKTDGLVWNDCNASSILADPDGSIWIGTSRGISHFYAAGAPPRPRSAKAVLTFVTLGDIPYQPLGGASVPYSRHDLHARFEAMTFVNEESVCMRYRLTGLEDRWTETEDDDAHYGGLPSGNYTFEVEAGFGPGTWSSPALFSFRIQPPWWMRWWAWCAEAVLCYLLGRQIWAWRVRRILNRQKALERAVDERTRELQEEKQHVMEQKQRAEERREIVEKQKVEIERLFHQAQESTRLKSEFLANISHEIRTPMNGIIGMTDLLFRTELRPDQSEFLRLVRISADSLLAVINDVLDFSKIEAGKFDLDAIDFDPVELLRDTVHSMNVLAQTKHLALRWKADTGAEQRLTGDPGRLRQVLINLVGNAIKFTEQGEVSAEMAVSAVEGGAADDVELRVAVRDTGIGIPAEKHRAIFEPFRQADGSTSRRYGGTGLGLAICARLVSLMGGRIWVDSRPGAGSTFCFTARVKRSGEAVGNARADEAEWPTAPERRLRVLVAEDNPVNRKLASRILEHAGHYVVCANDGREAVDTIARERFDIVLMDLQMPRMDGFEATSEIRKLDAALRVRTPIVALTANVMKGDRERCLDAGMDGYVSKPLRPKELFSVMAGLLSAG